MTNYEKIKSMSVDELAQIIEHSENCCEYCIEATEISCRPINCKIGIKKWLESEVEE